MKTSEIKVALLNQAIKVASFSAIDLSKQQMEADIEQLMQSIAAPTDFGGFYYVAQSLVNLLQLPGNMLEVQLDLKPYLIEALQVDVTNEMSKPDAAHYKKISAGNNWAKSNPLYLLLFGASGFKNTNDDYQFLAAFVCHFLQNKVMLEDPEIQPANHSRTEEVCRAIRKLQDKNQLLFSAPQLAQNLTNWHATEIASALYSVVSQNILDKDTARYAKTLIKFFASDWSKPRLKGPIGPQKNKRHGGGKRGGTRPELVTGDGKVAPAAVHLDEQGVDAQDVEVLRTHLSNELEEESVRGDEELSSIGAIFDSDLQKLGSINISRDLRQKNNLNLSSRLLLSAGSLRLLKNICDSRLNREAKNDIALAIYCMLSTGISLSELVKLKVIDNLTGTENGIVVTEHQCFWRMKHRMSAVTPVGQPGYFCRSDLWAMTPCSAVINRYIKTHNFKAGAGLFEHNEQLLRKRIDKLLQRVTEKNVAPYISVSMIESFLLRFMEAGKTVDPVVVDFSYQQEMYTTRVSRSYVNLSDMQRVDMLCQLWRDIADYAQDDTVLSFFRPLHASSEYRIGSRYVPTAEFCQQFISKLQHNLKNAKPELTLKLDSIVHYHNAYTRYTAWMLGFGTGYRAVHNPLPTLALHIPELQLMSISDKDDGYFSHSRVVAVAQTLNTQLQHLASHLIRLAELITILAPELFQQIRKILDAEYKLQRMTAEQITQWFISLRNSREEIGPLFYLDQKLKAKPVSPGWLTSDNGSFDAVPANMGRHWLKTALLSTGVPSELVNWQMGHWQEGQSPLFENSAMSMTESVAELAPLIEQLMTEQGWQAWKSDLI